MKSYRAIIWDYNGTIVDDVNAALDAVNDMLIKRNQPVIDLCKYQAAVDIPIWKFYETVFIKGSITMQDAINEFDAGYDKYISEHPLMNGVEDMLEHFKSLGIRQLVLSASHEDKVLTGLRKLGIIKYFDVVLARSDYNVGDKTYLAKQYFMDSQMSPDNAVVIGDCVNDFDVARSLGCDCILNTRGHQGVEQLSQTSALIIDSMYELKDLIGV